MKRFVKVITFISVLAISLSGFAADPIYTSRWNNNAAGGYDVVAYFTQNQPVKGKSKYSTKYKGAKWLFASAGNLSKFKSNPGKYAPQYGGYCAWAVSEQKDLVKGDPKHWSIYNDKLYLNYNRAIKNKWLQNKPEFVAMADKNWPSLLKK